MRVLGLDPGLAACGYAVVELTGRQATAVEFGCWQTPSASPLPKRLATLFVEVETLIGRAEPDTVAIEESFVGKDARAALSVGQVRGVLLVACANAGLACVEYPPASVKQAVCGYGQADKRPVQQMAKAILGLETSPTPTHAADALAVALCHAQAPPLLRLAS